MSLIPIDLRSILREGLEGADRPPDGLLHASTDLTGSLRHVQLRAAGAPKVPQPLLGRVRVMTGTFWHTWLTEELHKRGIPFMREVKLATYMPEGWSGTADWMLWSDEYQAFVLTDIKTCSEKGLGFIPKDEHIWQTSLYWHSLAKGMGLSVLEGIGVIYLPIDTKHSRSRPNDISFEVVEFDPIPLAKLKKEMNKRKSRVDEYLGDRLWLQDINPKIKPTWWLQNGLEPPQDRVQKLSKVGPKYELKLVPHWSTDYCEFPEELCDCSTQGVTKIGEFIREDGQWIYKPRKGYEKHEPEHRPKGRA